MSAIIRPLTEADLPAARRIVNTAFGTFLGASDVENFWADRDLVYGRFGADHVASFAAEVDGELVGSNFATNWGSVGFFGPLSIHPDQQGRGIAKGLVEAVSAQLDAWGMSHAGLFTFPRAPCTWRSTGSSASTRGSSPRSCPRRRNPPKARHPGRAIRNCPRASERPR